MKKKTILVSSLATALIIGGYFGYVQIAPHYIGQPPGIMKEEIKSATSEKEKIAQHIAFNFKLNNFGIVMVREVVGKLYHEDKDTKEYIVKKQTELADLIRQIEEQELPNYDPFLEKNKGTQLAYARTNQEVLSNAMAFYVQRTKENGNKLAESTTALTNQVNDLLNIKEDFSGRYDIKIALSEPVKSTKKFKEANNTKSIDDKPVTAGITISYQEGAKLHYIEVE
ncbi:hypothetical protein CVD28_04380 [Bacillus sp. M6-12]|uniref:hypothetical protein n=1 Tax=Bacillus sp. M6-12 TaxID=2054166 RepID=UPI000C765774|nr:hypothetical protein [Bacillus sp. M6-12]PLS19659.1 hypothetical protein CVD28_04380 [Bacillus sp. M6-12]